MHFEFFLIFIAFYIKLIFVILICKYPIDLKKKIKETYFNAHSISLPLEFFSFVTIFLDKFVGNIWKTIVFTILALTFIEIIFFCFQHPEKKLDFLRQLIRSAVPAIAILWIYFNWFNIFNSNDNINFKYKQIITNHCESNNFVENTTTNYDTFRDSIFSVDPIPNNFKIGIFKIVNDYKSEYEKQLSNFIKNSKYKFVNNTNAQNIPVEDFDTIAINPIALNYYCNIVDDTINLAITGIKNGANLDIRFFENTSYKKSINFEKSYILFPQTLNNNFEFISLFLEAIYSFKNHDFKNAVLKYDSIFPKINDKNLLNYVLYQRGMSKYKIKNLKDALNDFYNYLILNPNDIEMRTRFLVLSGRFIMDNYVNIAKGESVEINSDNFQEDLKLSKIIIEESKDVKNKVLPLYQEDVEKYKNGQIK